jgi:NADH dehydrogenase
MARRIVTVFGGSGFIGRHVVKRLAAAGATVRVAVRDTEAALFLKPMGDVGQIVLVPCDATDPALAARALEGADGAVNLVGILSEWGRRTFRRFHVEAAANVARAAAAAGVKSLVHVSALGADKDSPAAYARTKAEGEAAVRAAFPGAVILRPSVVFGPEDDFFNRFARLALMSPALPIFGCPTWPKVTLFPEGDLIRIDPYGAGGTRFQPVYVGDVAEAVTRSLDDPATAGRTYELGGPRVYSFKGIMDLLLAQIGRRRLIVPLPFALARVQAWFLEKWPQPLLTRDQVRLLEKDNVVSPGAAGLEELGIAPTAAEAILPTYLGRYRPRLRQQIGLA